MANGIGASPGVDAHGMPPGVREATSQAKKWVQMPPTPANTTATAPSSSCTTARPHRLPSKDRTNATTPATESTSTSPNAAHPSPSSAHRPHQCRTGAATMAAPRKTATPPTHATAGNQAESRRRRRNRFCGVFMAGRILRQADRGVKGHFRQGGRFSNDWKKCFQWLENFSARRDASPRQLFSYPPLGGAAFSRATGPSPWRG